MQPKVIKLINEQLIQIVAEEFGKKLEGAQVYVSEGHGDLTTKVAFILSASLKRPRDGICEILSNRLKCLSSVKSVNCLEGYVNIILEPSAWHDQLLQWLEYDVGATLFDLGKGAKVNLEYVSVNPTGPLHVGHARVAVYGDVLANLLYRFGYNVTKEFYVNDRGAQIDDLTESLFIRYKNFALKENSPLQKGLYPGEYLVPVAQKLYEEWGLQLLTGSRSIVREFALNSMMGLIKEDLKLLGIEHDIFTSEEELHKRQIPQNVISKLKKEDLVYLGTLPPPKGHVSNEDYSLEQQLLFKSTRFGDVQDRPVQKSDGTWTYFGSDLAYASDKINRDFESIIMVLGADHIGYLERLKAAVEALGAGKVKFEPHVCQLVKYLSEGKPVPMSKRSGEFATLRSLVDEVGSDAIRFMMLGRRAESQLEFDLVKVKEQSKDNPVFYVQYAYARAKSVLRKAEEISASTLHLHKLVQPEELRLIRKVVFCLPSLADAAKSRSPHKIIFFLQEIATQFHSLWDLKKVGVPYKFIVKEDPELTSARLALVQGFAKSLRLALELIGVTPPEFM
jgi:arginyl-tRNA synthetase